ncbi:MAG: Crp/Fnr family transcriptional regulator [Janthinobacterium lividum]
MPTGPFINTLLNHMGSDVITRLQLRRVELPLKFELEVPGEGIHSVFFVEEGIGSMTTCFGNGAQVETSMFGYESAVGVSALMGTKHSLNRIFMQLAGYGYASPVRAAQTEFQRGEIFQKLALRYVQAQLTLSTQNAACNASHTYEQRLARWLLICADRAKKDHLEMAQEFVSEMLGSTRSTVSIAAAHLKTKGLIDYHRGSIQLLKKKELEVEACECYRVVRNHLETFAHFDTGFAV